MIDMAYAKRRIIIDLMKASLLKANIEPSDSFLNALVQGCVNMRTLEGVESHLFMTFEIHNRGWKSMYDSDDKEDAIMIFHDFLRHLDKLVGALKVSLFVNREL